MTALLISWPGQRKHPHLDMSKFWPRLTGSTQTWLMEHNGEPLPDEIVDKILAVTAGQRDPHWWAWELPGR